MSTKSVITRELSESVRNILGRNVKISLKCLVRMETKPEKTENRLLAFSACRLFILTAKVPTKIEHTFHYLDIQAIESKKQNQLLLTLEGKLFTFYSMDPESEDVNHMIIQLGTAIKSVFPQVPLEYILRKIDVVPPSRLQAMIEYNQDLETKDPGPCGGFSTQYACMCDYHGLPYRDEVAWDVDTIYLSHDCKELSLQDFDHLEGRDLVPIISALSYNAWFTKFRASNTRLTSEALEQILLVMKRSISIEELYLDNTGIKWDFAHKLSLALISNTFTPLHTLDLSNNLIEDKGINSLCGIIAKITQGAGQLSGPVGKLQKGLMHLNLARTGVTARGVNTLAHALSLNRAMPSTLTYLNLSDNIFKEDINNLYNFLAQPNALTHLDLSGTECALDTVFGALLRGCTQKLAHLNLARNQFSTKKSKDTIVPPSFKAFFSSTVALKYLNMSGNKLPNEALKGMLLGLACNEIATDVALDMSSNELRSQGALVLESCLPGIRCLGLLDVSDNGFDADLAAIVTAVGKNKSIRHLSIGRNFVNLKPKHITKVLDAVVQLIQEEDSVLESLSLAESKLRADTCLIINALGSNQCLTSLDITGNYMGLAGAKTLAKALQINSKLRSILWDRNGTPPQGFQDIAYALEKNYSLRYMPCPIFDVTAAMKVAPEKTEAAMKKIEELLHRNVSPKKLCNGQAFRLQQGFLLSTTHQMVDRLMVHVQDAIGTHKSSSDESLACVDEIEKAESFLHDANNAKQLLTRLHEVVLQQEESGNPVELKLQDFALEMASILENYVKGTASCMLKCVEDQCPNIMCDEKVRRDVERLCQEKGVIPSDFIRQSLLDQAAADIINKVSEVNLAMAAHISDRILDEVIESLSRSHKGLVERMKQQRCSTPDVLRNRTRLDGTIRSSQSGESHLDNLSENSESPTATPKLPSKRKSVHNRKVRPRSVVDHVEGIAADDIPDLLPKDTDDRSLPNLSPMSEKLEHLGKGRPKRPKTRAPTRPCIQTREIREDSQDLDEGLAHFFRRHHKTTNTTPSMSPDIEEPRFRTESNSTSASSIVITSEISSSRQSLEKSPENNVEKRGFMRGITNFLSRMTTDTSHVHKSKSYDLTDKVESPASSPNHRVAEDDSKISHSSPQLECRAKKQNGDVSRNSLPEPIAKEDSPRLSGIEKIGIPLSPVKGRGADLLAEMRARQEKRTLVSPVQKPGTDEKPGAGSPENSPSLLQSVKLKPTGLAESLRSPTDAFPKDKRDSGSPTVSSTPSSPIGCRNTPGLKYRPPPVAPKPRPKSVIGTTDSRLSGEFILSPEDVGSSELSASNQEVSDGTELPSLPEVTGTKESVSVRVKSMYLTKEVTEVAIKSSTSLVNVSGHVQNVDSACNNARDVVVHSAIHAGSNADNPRREEQTKCCSNAPTSSPVVEESGISDITDV